MAATAPVGDEASVNTIRKQKASLLSLDHHMRKTLVIEPSHGGRMVRGLLQGFDSNMNLILTNAVIVHQDSDNPFKPVLDGKDICRELGATIVRGNIVAAIYGLDGTVLQTKEQ